jgi:putative FmdB family regulatory protein
MPIFEYVCDDCGSEFETLVLCRDENVSCSNCSSANLTKKMSTCAVKSGEKFTSTASADSCSGCTGKNCSTCH